MEAPCPVDRCCSCTALLVSTKRTTALPWRGPDHCSRTCSLTHCQCRHNILIDIGIYLAAFWLPKSLDYSGHAIQVHTQERAIQVLTQEHAIQVPPKNVLSKCTPKNVLSKCTPKNVLSKCTLRMCYPSAHPRTCYPSARYTRAPLHTLIHHSVL